MIFMPILVEIFPSPRLLGAPRLFGSLEYSKNQKWPGGLQQSLINVKADQTRIKLL